jgi:hypothetical protein
MPRWPRSLDDLDRLLGADPPIRGSGLLACFEPALPSQAHCDPEVWHALRVRADERRREWRGPIGDRVRALESDGLVRIDEHGLVCDARTGAPLDRAGAEEVAG